MPVVASRLAPAVMSILTAPRSPSLAAKSSGVVADPKAGIEPGSVRLECVIGDSRQSTALRVASGETDELATELRASVDIGPRVDQQAHDLVLLLNDRPVQRCLFAAAALGVDVCAGDDECLDH